MTLREIDNLMREPSEASGEPMDRLVAVLAILRSLRQGEIATNEGIAASVNMFRLQYGAVTHESVDRFMDMPSSVLDTEIPNDYIDEMMAAD